MINLLPPTLKSNYRYARRNVSLRRWLVVLLITLVGLGAIGTYGMLTLHQSKTSYSSQVTADQAQLKKEKLTQTEGQIQDISSSLRLAVKVLSQEVLFSKLIQRIGAVMPTGTILTDLDISQASGGLELEADASNYSTATQAQVNLAAPANGIFSKVDIESIDCGNASTNAEGYPCTVQLRALFNTDNPFLFINQGKS